MSTRRARPVITVVDARPMSEVGFPGTSFEHLRQPASSSSQPDSSGSSNRSSAANQSGNSVQPATNDSSRPPARAPPPRPQAPSSPVAESTAKPKPEPKPRPRSMVIPKSTSLSILNQESLSAQDKQASHEKSEQLRKPVTTGKPTIIRPLMAKPSVGMKNSDMSGQQGVAAFDADKRKPPVLKPKPTALPRYASLTDLPTREADNSSANGVNTAADNARRRPTIIRPSLPTAGPSSQHLVTPNVQAPTASSDAKDSLKTVGQTLASKQLADSSKDADWCVSISSEMATKQGRAKPTIIRMNKVPFSDSSKGSSIIGQRNYGRHQQEAELDSHEDDQCAIESNDIRRFSAVNDSSLSAEVDNTKNHALEKTFSNKEIDVSAHGVRPKPPSAASKPPVGVPSRTSDMRHSQAEQHMHASNLVLEPVKLLPPSKPPPPRNTVTRVSSHSISAAVSTKEPSSQRPESRRPPPLRPSGRPKEQIGSPPPLPTRPTPGHPLYHYVCQGPRALALFDYTTSQPDELSFSAGDIIVLEKWVNSEWMIGSTGNNHGMFPVNFVEIQEPLPCEPPVQSVSISSSVTSKTSPSDALTGPRCIARFDYEAGEPDDLDFVSGDVIRIIERVNDEWLRGELKGKTGVFPVAFVEIVEDLPFATSAEPQGTDWSSSSRNNEELDDGPFCIAVFDFAGERAEDLSFLVGDKIVLLAHVNSEWLRGSVHGREGIFPAAFVNIVKDLTDLPPRPKATTVETKLLSERDLVQSSQAGASYDGAFSERQAVALYDFDGDPSKGDLPFNAGDVIVDLTTVSEDWMSGRIGSQTGMFPTAFVRVT